MPACPRLAGPFASAAVASCTPDVRKHPTQRMQPSDVTAHGILLEDEFRALKDAFKPLVEDVEARNRVKRCSLVPVSVVVAACGAYGETAQTVALLRALHQLPRQWALQMEQERNHERLEHDLLIEQELAELEEEGVHLAAELGVMAPYAEIGEDDAAAASWRLPSTPPALAKELDDYAKYRAEPLNRTATVLQSST